MLCNGETGESVKPGARGREGTVLRSHLGAGCAVDGAGRTQRDKWPPAPLFAVASSTHFEKVREPGGENVTLPSHFVPNKVYSFM